MLKLMLGNQVDEGGAPLFEPEWEPQWGEDQRLLNAPMGADGTLALFYQLEESGVGAAEEVPPLAPVPMDPPPVAGDPDLKQILIRLVQAQAAKNLWFWLRTQGTRPSARASESQVPRRPKANAEEAHRAQTKRPS